MLTATYSPEDNKLRLRASARLDAETYERVRAHGFAWAAKQDLFVAPAWTPQREDLLIELCGSIDDEDTSLAERAEARAERFGEYSDKRAADASSAKAAVSAIADHIPFGQPILVGHHSERHARRDAERIQNGMRKAIRLWDTSEYWTRRAAGVARHAAYKERPDVRARRIKTLEAEERSFKRTIEKAEDFRRAWTKIRTPLKDGSPCDGTAALMRAREIANYDHTSLWSGLDKGTISPDDAARAAIEAHDRIIAGAERWLKHLANRLAYERALLADSGWTPPAPKKSKAALPLLNRAGEIKVRNAYHNNIETYVAHPMTKAEYAAINKDYKGTRVSECGTHRVRSAVVKGGLCVVYLSDSKIHALPSKEEADAKGAQS